MFLCSLLLGNVVQAEPSVVFLGNSYTQYNNLSVITSSMLQNNIRNWDQVEHLSLLAGGLNLADHADRVSNPNSEWYSVFQENNDIYILQDQSQTPAFGEGISYFDDSLAGLIEMQEIIEQQNAMTVLFLTWGRRDGDSQNPAWFPDYETMQESLNDGYLTYAERASNNSQIYIAPIGPIFGEIKLQDENLFRDLYSQDGSHPSQIGSTTSALGLVASLTGRSISEIPTDLSAEEQAIINLAVEQVVLHDAVGVFPLPWVWTEVPEDGVIAHELMRPLLLVDEDYNGDLNVLDGRVWLESGQLQGGVVLGEESEFQINGGNFIGDIDGSVVLNSGTLSSENIDGDLSQLGGSIILGPELNITGQAILGMVELTGEEACISATSINIDNLEAPVNASIEMISGESEILCLRVETTEEPSSEPSGEGEPAEEPSGEPATEEPSSENADDDSSTTKDSKCSGSGVLVLLPFLGFFGRRRN